MPIPAWQQILEQFSDGEGRRAPLASHEITARDTTSHQRFVKRKRMSQEERQLQILRAAGMVIAVKGYWGMTLQDISNEIGLSEAALYHYIDSKEDLLDMVLTEGYDTTEANEFSALTASVSDVDGHRVYFFPRYLLNTVLYNMQRPEMTQLFCVLSGEALNPDHPAHRFFTGRHNRLWEMVGSMSWLLPPGIDEERLFDLYTLAASAIDGLQTRWLADDSINLVDEWIRFSETIFPASTWTGYLDPSEHDPEDTRCLLPYTLQER